IYVAFSFETGDNRRIINYHRVQDTCSMVRISAIRAVGRAETTYLATLGTPELHLFPHALVGASFLVDYPRHSHDAFLLLQRILAASFGIVSREQFGRCQTGFD